MLTPREIHWRDLLGNPYRFAIHKHMLLPDGYLIHTMGRVKGMSKSAESIPLIVFFDREYVIEKINLHVLTPLNVHSYNELQTIISQAWKKWKT